jgi:hypothetical protein
MKVVQVGKYSWETRYSWWDRHGGTVIFSGIIAAIALAITAIVHFV